MGVACIPSDELRLSCLWSNLLPVAVTFKEETIGSCQLRHSSMQFTLFWLRAWVSSSPIFSVLHCGHKVLPSHKDHGVG